MNTITTLPKATGWFQTLKQEGFYFRQAAIFVIAFGAYLHLTRLFVGDEILLQRVLTPTLDKLFAIPMLYASLAGILSWKHMMFGSRGQKAFVTFIIFYITISVPLHVATYFTNSTDFFVRSFPVWVSLVWLPYFTVIIVTLLRLRYQEAR
jgi:hypothetical protein